MTGDSMPGGGQPAEPRVEMVDPHMAQRWIERGEAVLVDVREPQEFAMEHIANAESIPLSAFDPARIPAAPDKRMLLMCASGVRCGMAALVLLRAGHTNVYRMAGGLMGWKSSGGAVVQGR